jgi:hypothetical protein
MNAERRGELRDMMLELGAVITSYRGDKPLTLFVAIEEGAQLFTTHLVNVSDVTGTVTPGTAARMAASIWPEIDRFLATIAGFPGPAEHVSADELDSIEWTQFSPSEVGWNSGAGRADGAKA